MKLFRFKSAKPYQVVVRPPIVFNEFSHATINETDAAHLRTKGEITELDAVSEEDVKTRAAANMFLRALGVTDAELQELKGNDAVKEFAKKKYRIDFSGLTK